MLLKEYRHKKIRRKHWEKYKTELSLYELPTILSFLHKNKKIKRQHWDNIKSNAGSSFMETWNNVISKSPKHGAGASIVDYHSAERDWLAINGHPPRPRVDQAKVRRERQIARDKKRRQDEVVSRAKAKRLALAEKDRQRKRRTKIRFRNYFRKTGKKQWER